MLRRIITEEIVIFMVGVIEITAFEFYDKDRASAFKDLNEKKIWHNYIEKFESKRNMKPEAIADEIGGMLGKEKAPSGNVVTLTSGDAEFITKIIRLLAKEYDLNYSVSFEKFYSSNVCSVLSTAEGGFSSLTLGQVLELFAKEFTK